MEPNAAPAFNDTSEVCLAIKKILKGKGLSYRNLSEMSGIPLSTLKKSLSSSSLQVAQLLKICSALEVDLSALEKSLTSYKSHTQLTEEQEEYFCAHAEAYIVFIMMYRGWEKCFIQETIDLAEDDWTTIVKELESLGLVVREDSETPRVLVKRQLEINGSGRLQKGLERAVTQQLLDKIYDKKISKALKTISVCSLRMSETSLRKIIFGLEEIAKTAKSLALNDGSLHPDDSYEMTLLMAAAPIDTAILDKKRLEESLQNV